METLASFAGHHPGICCLQYETLGCLTLPLKMQSFTTVGSTNRHWCLLWYMTSKVTALPDNTVIVNIISRLHLEPGGVYLRLI